MGLLRAGSLDRLVTLQRRAASTHDGFGKKLGEWGDLARRWASVKSAGAGGNVKGTEGNEASGRGGVADVSFWLYWDSVSASLTTADAILYDGKRYEIVAPPGEIGRREGIEVFARQSELVSASQ